MKSYFDTKFYSEHYFKFVKTNPEQHLTSITFLGDNKKYKIYTYKSYQT